MPSRADVERFADANRDIRTLVTAALERLWQSLNTLDANATRDFLLDAVPLLVEEYGGISATVAADFYDALRDDATVSSRFTASVVSADLTELAGQIRWSIGPLFSATPDPDAALGRLSQKVDEFTLQYGRDTIAANSSRDPAKPRWARVPMGDTCAFCISLASRGAVYVSYESARYKGSGSGKYHGDCDCQPVAMFDGASYPEGYDPDALFQQYQDARDAAKSGSIKPILSKLREQQGTH